MSDTTSSAPAEKLTKKQLKADHPTWCPACGDFAVLASFFNVVQKLGIPHEKIVCVAGIGCSSRFPYFVNTHGIHFIHGRALPLATGISLSRPDLHVFVFGGDGDGFSIGGNHLYRPHPRGSGEAHERDVRARYSAPRLRRRGNSLRVHPVQSRFIR